MHRIDPMNKKRATVVLMNFRHPLLKLGKQNVLGNPPDQKRMITMTRISFKKLACPFSVCLCVNKNLSEARKSVSVASRPPAGARISKGPVGP